MISTSEFNHKLGSHVKGKKHPPCADVTPHYNWCFSMDSDQNVQCRLYRWTVCGWQWQFSLPQMCSNLSNGIFSTNAASLNYTILIAYNRLCTRLDFNANLQHSYQPVPFSAFSVDYQRCVCPKHFSKSQSPTWSVFILKTNSEFTVLSFIFSCTDYITN